MNSDPRSAFGGGPNPQGVTDAGVSFDGRAAMLQNLEQAGMPAEMIAMLRGGMV